MILSAEVGLSERFSLTAALPFRSADLTSDEAIHATGMGDLQLGARHALTDPEKQSRFSAVTLYGIWLPTGASNDTGRIEENVSFTRGAPTLTAGSELSFQLGDSSRIFGQIDLQYPTGGDEVNDPNGRSASYRFAPSRSASIIFSRGLGEGKVTWLAGMSQRYFGTDRLNGAGVETRGGSIRRIVGGLVFNVSRRQNIGVIAERLAHANVNGDNRTREGQILAVTEYVVAWQGTFGTHRHDDVKHGH